MTSTPPAIPFEELLRHAGWLRGLAGALVADSSEAEDLVQETWLAALRTPPRDRRNLQGWLSRTLRNAFRHRVRSGAHRTEREQRHAREPVPTPDELVGRMEVQRLLAEELIALPEPLRSTLLLRFYEGLSGAEIAEAQSVAPGTVRWRIHEGLDRLRQRLDARHRRRSSWMTMLLPIARPGAAWGTQAAGLLGGATAMNLSVKLAASASLALLVLGFGIWSLVDPDPPPPVPSGETSSAAVEGSIEGGSENAQRSALAEPPSPPPASPGEALPSQPTDPTEAELAAFAGSSPPGSVEGIVLRGRSPVAGGFAWLGATSSGGLPWADTQAWDRAPHAQRTTIDADGIFRFDGLSADDYYVGVQTPDGAERRVIVTVRADEPTARVRIVLGSASIHGRVYDEQAAPARGWQVAAYNYGSTLAEVQLISRAVTDEEGAFAFDELTRGSYVVIASPNDNFARVYARERFIDLAADEHKTVTIGSAAGASLWSGRVLLPRGEPLRIAGLTELRIRSGGVRHTAALSEGGFRVEVPAGTYELDLFAYGLAGGASAGLGSIEVPSGAFERDVSLPRSFVRVRARYAGSRGDPQQAVASLVAKLELDQGKGTLTSVRESSGPLCFFAVPAGEHRLSCSRPILGAPQGGLIVRVDEGEDEVEVDIAVGDR